jgi:hypothetical protein
VGAAGGQSRRVAAEDVVVVDLRRSTVDLDGWGLSLSGQIQAGKAWSTARNFKEFCGSQSVQSVWLYD